jgi:antitoxin component YwqK of YwqJK toxin-antitoxin module
MTLQIIGICLGLPLLIWVFFRFILKKQNPFRLISYWTTTIISFLGLTIIFFYLLARAFGGPPPKEGWNRTYFENGEIQTEFFVEDGQITGDHKSWYKNGQLKFLTKYQNGQEVDTSFCFYENGLVNFLSVYEGEKEIYTANYYPNGQIESETYNPVDSNTENYRIDYHPNGIKRFETKINNSTFEGKGYYYFEDGKIQYEGEYKEGQKNGIWLKRDSITGNIIDKDTFDFRSPERFKDTWKWKN